MPSVRSSPSAPAASSVSNRPAAAGRCSSPCRRVSCEPRPRLLRLDDDEGDVALGAALVLAVALVGVNDAGPEVGLLHGRGGPGTHWAPDDTPQEPNAGAAGA